MKELTSCPHCSKGILKKVEKALTAKNGYFICDNCYATKVVGEETWVRPVKRVLYLDKNNYPMFAND